MNRIRKGDQVLVITGKNKGQRGDVLRVADDRVFVSNVNLIKRHTNPATNKGERVGTKTLVDGRKVRVFRSTGEVVDA